MYPVSILAILDLIFQDWNTKKLPQLTVIDLEDLSANQES